MECLSKKHYFLPLITAFAAIYFLSLSCYYDNYEDLYKNFPKDSCDVSTVTYSAEISSILTANCATSGCHVGPAAQSGLDLSQYSDAKNAADDGRLVGRITGNKGSIMPPTHPLPPCEIEKIKTWVLQGALNN